MSSDPFEGIQDDAAVQPRVLDPDPGAVDRHLGVPPIAPSPAPPPVAREPLRPPLQHGPGTAENPKPATMSTSSETRLVRIKPYNKKRRQLTRRYTVHGVKFEVQKGWYRVRLPVAEYLRGVTSDGDPDSPTIFDVCTEDQAIETERVERLRAMERAGGGPHGAADPRDMGDQGLDRMGVLTTRDLRNGHDSRMRSTWRE